MTTVNIGDRLHDIIIDMYGHRLVLLHYRQASNKQIYTPPVFPVRPSSANEAEGIASYPKSLLFIDHISHA